MPPLTPELEDFILTRIDMLFYDIQDFENVINKQIALMTSNGLGRQEIANVLSQDLKNNGPLFGKLKNSTKAKLVETVNQSSRVGQMKVYEGHEKFAWVTVGGHKVCMDCDGRTGMILTYDQWETEGMPGSGWSVCQGFCYCVLDPTGKVGDKVNVDTKVSEPGPKRKKGFTQLTPRKIRKNVGPEMKKAAQAEAAITDDVVDIGIKGNMDQHGIKYKLKDLESAERKFLKEHLDNKWTAQQVFSEDFKDLIRYTYLVDDVTYLDDVLASLAEFEARGYKIDNLRNYWGGTQYKGLNVNLIDPKTGRMFEIQFNTPTSQKIKDSFSHSLYERIRLPGISEAEKLRLEILMERYWDECPNPFGFEQISNFP